MIHTRSLCLGAGLVAVLGILAGPVGLPRSDAQAKKAEQKGDVVVGGGVEQVAFINE